MSSPRQARESSKHAGWTAENGFDSLDEALIWANTDGGGVLVIATDD
ncbi:MAG: hypothetical protein WBB76_10285 [Gaiellaceae bacterium]